jgi:hypothetical protein
MVVCDIRQDGLYLAVDQPSVDPTTLELVEDYEHERFNYIPDAVGYLVPFAELDPAVTLLQPAHDAVLELATAKSDKAPFRTAHSPGVLAMLREAGHEVPDPSYAAIEFRSASGGAARVSEPLAQGIGRRTEPLREPHPSFSIEEAASETHLDPSMLRDWVRAINRKGQAILYGPPGTGKTYVAERLRRHLLAGGDGYSDLVQFHAAYAYEDFIQGLRPRATPNGHGLMYGTVPGRFMEFCAEAEQRSGVSVLIIDEINRANLAEVFGELMYLLEYRDRELPLAGGGRLRIPPNVRIIGTMNTADRSTALVDHALRRRFAFLRLEPNVDVLARYHQAFGRDVTGLTSVLQQLNARIADPHYSVGISFFMRQSLSDDLEAIWSGEIEPYIEELFFDRRQEVEPFRWVAIRDRVQS